ncbi:GDP-mannose 4,6-dehydratase [Pseudoduganella sp. GCM10020061]|uniref:GDP-mannose 4,6-dehydratase n=1 Tax=Pseudoduganella sp. GCM10020061 TaxID=3317345 RepID=UPI00364335E1
MTVPADRSPAPASGGTGAGKRALVTGVHGFTGHYMAEVLAAEGYRVFGTVQPGDARADAHGDDNCQVDLCDRAAVRAAVDAIRPDVVVHLAAISFVAHSDPDLIYRVNLIGTRHLLEALAAQEHKPEAVLLASSANVYGNADLEAIGEDTPPSPANDYAVSKLSMEYMARLWMDKLPITIVRPFNYTGAGQHENFLLPKIVAHFRRGERRIELGNLAIARDFSDVRMVVDAYRRLLVAGKAGQVFNVCSGVAHSLQDVLSMMSRIAGYSIDVSVNPTFVRANDVLKLAGSNARLVDAIGPLRTTPLEETLRWMYQA